MESWYKDSKPRPLWPPPLPPLLFWRGRFQSPACNPQQQHPECYTSFLFSISWCSLSSHYTPPIHPLPLSFFSPSVSFFKEIGQISFHSSMGALPVKHLQFLSTGVQSQPHAPANISQSLSARLSHTMIKPYPAKILKATVASAN